MRVVTLNVKSCSKPVPVFRFGVVIHTVCISRFIDLSVMTVNSNQESKDRRNLHEFR